MTAVDLVGPCPIQGHPFPFGYKINSEHHCTAALQQIIRFIEDYDRDSIRKETRLEVNVK